MKISVLYSSFANMLKSVSDQAYFSNFDVDSSSLVEIIDKSRHIDHIVFNSCNWLLTEDDELTDDIPYSTKKYTFYNVKPQEFQGKTMTNIEYLCLLKNFLDPAIENSRCNMIELELSNHEFKAPEVHTVFQNTKWRVTLLTTDPMPR